MVTDLNYRWANNPVSIFEIPSISAIPIPIYRKSIVSYSVTNEIAYAAWGNVGDFWL